MAACCARGQTVLDGCAVEPEVVDLARFLSCAGGVHHGRGHAPHAYPRPAAFAGRALSHLPGPHLHRHAAVRRGGLRRVSVTLRGARAQDCAALLRALRRAGCEVVRREDAVSLRRTGALHAPGALVTDVHPGAAHGLSAAFGRRHAAGRGSNAHHGHDL